MNAVVFDLDDTLLHDDLTISDFTVRVFQALASKGFHIIAASGRSQFSMKPYLDQLACVSAYISSNGAEIWDGPAHRLIRKELFSAELSREIACFAEQHDCYAELEDLKALLADEKKASVVVKDTVYPGVKVAISDVSKIIKEPVKYCRFVKERGDVKMVGMN